MAGIAYLASGHDFLSALDDPEPIPSAGPAPNGKNRPVVTPVTSITEPLTVTVKASCPASATSWPGWGGSSTGTAVQSSSSAGTMMPSPSSSDLGSGMGILPADHHHQTAGEAWPVGQLRLLVDVRPASQHRPGSACFMAPAPMRAWGRYSGVNANLIVRICAGRQPDFWRISSL